MFRSRELKMSYKVYLHTVPKDVTGYDYDKYYVGISSKPNLEDRWGEDGYGYNGQVFYLAIKKYGWNNIKHDILLEGLSQEEALKKEKEYIKLYKSRVCDGHGYNILKGGSKYDGSRIYQFDSYGNIINIFNDYDTLYVEIGIIPQDVHSACIGDYIQSGGYVWRYEKDIKDLKSFQDELKSQRIRCIEPIYQYDLDSNFIKRWNNSLELYGYFKSTRGIRHICNGVLNLQAYGYLWRYEKDVKLHGNPKLLKYESNSYKIVRFSLDGKVIKVYRSARYVCIDEGLKDTRELRESINVHKPYRDSFWEYEHNLKEDGLVFRYGEGKNKFSLGLIRDGKMIQYLGSAREAERKLGIDRSIVREHLDNHTEIFENTFVERVSTINIRYRGGVCYE